MREFARKTEHRALSTFRKTAYCKPGIGGAIAPSGIAGASAGVDGGAAGGRLRPGSSVPGSGVVSVGAITGTGFGFSFTGMK